MTSEIEIYRDALIKILSEETVNLKRLRTLTKSVGVKLPKDEIVFNIMIHKLRVNMPSVPNHLQDISREWLIQNDFSLDIDFKRAFPRQG